MTQKSTSYPKRYTHDTQQWVLRPHGTPGSFVASFGCLTLFSTDLDLSRPSTHEYDKNWLGFYPKSVQIIKTPEVGQYNLVVKYPDQWDFDMFNAFLQKDANQFSPDSWRLGRDTSKSVEKNENFQQIRSKKWPESGILPPG